MVGPRTVTHAAGRGMLSVIVVHKQGDMQPGPGFFELAQRLGRDTSDTETGSCILVKSVSIYALAARLARPFADLHLRSER